jgi:hypothetical protein
MRGYIATRTQMKKMRAQLLLACLALGVLVLVFRVVLPRSAGAQSTSLLCCNPVATNTVGTDASSSTAKTLQCTPSSVPCPSNTQVVFYGTAPISLAVEETEPPEGFQGACRLPYLTYAPQLPTVCYAPPADPTGQKVKYASGSSTEIVLPASAVFHPHWSLPPQYDSFEAVMTCYPHDPGSCPAPSLPVSRSCCGAPTLMTCKDGIFANGGRGTPPSWDGYFAHGLLNFSLK